MKNKRLLLVITPLFSLLSFNSSAQSKIVYGGANYSNVRAHNSPSSNNFYPGFQVGFYRGGKTINLFKRTKLLTTGFAFEYNQLNYTESDASAEQETAIRHHTTRFSVPFRFRLTSANSQHVQLRVNLEPGINFYAVKTEDRQIIAQHGVPAIDLYTKTGLTLSLLNMKKTYTKSGYKLAGLFIAANRYISTNPLKVRLNTTLSVDQFMLNCGLQFNYVKVSTRKRWFGKSSSKKRK